MIYGKNNKTIDIGYIINLRNKSYLAILFYDEDNDIVIAKYADGELATEDFKDIENTIAIELTNTGIVTFEAAVGTYTFYALDSKGNETVKVVEIAKSRNGHSDGGWQSRMPVTAPISHKPKQLPIQVPSGMYSRGFEFPNSTYSM